MRRRGGWSLYLACKSGATPAELLPTSDRELLLAELSNEGWTVTQIAEHTMLSTYTTGRILERLGLEVMV